MILIPILVSLGIPVSAARPVGLFFNTLSMTGASVSNIKNKRVDFNAGIPIIIFSFVFSAVGAYVSKFIASDIILIGLIIFLSFSGFMLLFFRIKSNNKYSDKNPYLYLSFIGIFVGFISGILGIGGGAIISPLLIILGYCPKKIAAITALVIPFSSFSGFLTYWAIGNVDWKLTIIAASGGFIGAVFGTWLMQKKLKPVFIKKFLAIILLAMAVKMIISLFK